MSMRKSSVVSVSCRARIAALLALTGLAGGASAQTDVHWAAPSSGTWSMMNSWNPNMVPNNAGPNTFNAFFDAAGPAYQCDLDIDVTLSNLSLTSASATLNLGTTNTLNVLGNYTQQGSMVMGSVGRSATTNIGGTATFRGTTLMHGGQFMLGAIVCDTDPGTDVDICDTDVDASGFSSMLGNGNVLMGAGSQVHFLAGSSVTISGNTGFHQDAMANNSEALTVSGTMTKSGATGNSQFMGIRLNNAGTIDVATGTLTADNTLTANALPAGGAWVVRNNATLDFATQTMNTNQASVTLDGSNAAFTQLGAITSNAAGGSITLANGKAQTFTNALSNAGTLSASGTGSSITAASTLTNTGTIALAGTNTALTINATSSNSGTLTLNGSGGHVNANAPLSNSGTIMVTGGNAQLVVGAGASLTNAAAGHITLQAGTNSIQSAGNVTNNGVLTLGAGTALNVSGAGQLTNYNGGTRTLAGGTFDLGSGATVQFGGTTIRTLNSKVVLADTTSKFTSTGADDILRGPVLPQGNQSELQAIGPTGDLSFGSGENFNTSATTNFTVSPGGRLSVGAGSVFTVPTGHNLTNFNGGIFQDGTFNIQGTLRADNLAISTINNVLTLDGATSVFQNTAGQDALLPLNTVGASGALTVANGRSVTTAGALSVQAGGSLSLRSGSFTAGGPVSVAGTLQGTGTLTGSPTISGLFNPGNSPGLFNVVGDVTFAAGSTGRFEIGGLLAGVQYDQIAIQGALNFDALSAGNLDVVVLPTYTPTFGDTFDIITYNSGSRSGQFATATGLVIDAFYHFDVVYLGDRIQLVVIPAPGAGAMVGLGLLAAARRRRR